jgi:hypothetical protein
MDIKMVSGLISAILFIVFASSQAFSVVRDLGIKDKDTSMIVRSALSGIFMYLTLSMLL